MPLVLIFLDDEEDVSPVLPKLTLPSLQNDQLSDNLFKVLFDFSDIGITFAKDAIVLFGKLNLGTQRCFKILFPKVVFVYLVAHMQPVSGTQRSLLDLLCLSVCWLVTMGKGQCSPIGVVCFAAVCLEVMDQDRCGNKSWLVCVLGGWLMPWIKKGVLT